MTTTTSASLAPPRVGHRYHVRAEQHPRELVTFTAWCLEVTVGADGTVDSRWDNGVILVARGALYYANDPWST